MDTATTYLRAWHDATPGVTPRAFARGRLPDGRSTYAHLAGWARGVTVDLGCGDGELGRHAPGLIGLDLSRSELARAEGARALARADHLPLRTAAIDTVLSHLALSLMTPLPEIAAELARVLRPGGRLVAIVGGGPVEPPPPGCALHAFLDRTRAARARAPHPPLGDHRARTADGWRQVFAPHGFAIDDGVRMVVDLAGSVEQVWPLLAGAYGAERLAAADLDEARDQVAALAQGGQVACQIVVWRLAATRIPGNPRAAPDGPSLR